MNSVHDSTGAFQNLDATSQDTDERIGAGTDRPMAGTVLTGTGSGLSAWKKPKPYLIFTLTDAASIEVDWTVAAIQTVTLGGNRTFTFIQPKNIDKLMLFLKQDGTGSRTITWPTIKWRTGAAPTLTTTAAKTDIITLFYDGTSYWGDAGLNFS